MATILIWESATQTRENAASDSLLEAAIGALREPVRRFVSEAKQTADFWDLGRRRLRDARAAAGLRGRRCWQGRHAAGDHDPGRVHGAGVQARVNPALGFFVGLSGRQQIRAARDR